MVIGDVNVDSIVSASGDVAVFGRLSGEVHAGNNGDSSATVSAICFEPSQIRIADVVAVMGGPTSSEPTPYPEVARVEWPRSTPKQRLSREPGRDQQQGRIMVEPAGQFWQQLSARGRKRRAARLMAEGKLKWSPPAKSARLTGLYLLVAGISLFLAPKSTFGECSPFRSKDLGTRPTDRALFLSLFSLSLSFGCGTGLLFDVRTIAPGWIQVFGVIAAALGLYCECIAAQRD